MKTIETLAEFLGLRVESAEISAEAAQVVESMAIRAAATYTAVSLIAGAIEQCEIVVMRDGKRSNDELAYAWNVSPNPNQSGAAFLYSMIESYFYRGDCLVVKPKPSKNHFYVAQSFNREEYQLGEDRFTGVAISCGKQELPLTKTFRAGDVVYLTQGNKQVAKAVKALYGEMGRVLDYAMDSFKSSGDRFTFTRNSRPGGTPEEDTKRRQALQDSLRTFINAPNGVLPITPDQKFERVPVNSKAATATDVVTLRKDIYEATAAAFKIPVSLLYGNMTNISEIVEQFLTFAIDPLATEIGNELSRKFFTFEEYKAGSRIIVDTTGIEHVGLFSIAAGADKLISSGLCNVDEVRERAGLIPNGDEFSTTHWMTKNYDRADTALTRDAD